MDFIWYDYNPDTMNYIEDWLDEITVRNTGLDDGFRSFYEYWKNEENFVLNHNFWCKVVLYKNEPIAVITLCLDEYTLKIMELIVSPEKRKMGLGTKIIKEVLTNIKLIGFVVNKSEVIIYPNNIASQNAFQNAGFKYHYTHENGDAMIFVYNKK